MATFKDEFVVRFQKVVFPDCLNDNEILFGGKLLGWLDEIAYITATRLIKRDLVTVSVNNIRFRKPITAGSIIEIEGKLDKITPLKIYIKADVYIIDKYSDFREKAVESDFVFAQINTERKPVKLGL